MDNTTRRQQQYATLLSESARAQKTANYRLLTPFQKRLMSVLGAGLCFLSELIHLYFLPQQYEIYLIYGCVFLFIAMAQGFVGASLLFEPGRRLLSCGIGVNLFVVLLYIFTHTIGVVIGLGFLPLPIDAWGIGATVAESVAVLILWFLRRATPSVRRYKS